MDIYRFVGEFDEADIKLQTEETEGYKLADANEIKQLAEQGIFLHYDSMKAVFEE